MIRMTENALATFAKLYDEPDVSSLEARLPALHSQELLTVLEKLASVVSLTK